jgi:WD40 repeat protein
MSSRVARFVALLVAGFLLGIPLLGAEDPPQDSVRRFGTQRFRHQGYLTDVAFPADGKFLATVGTDGCLRLWDPASGKLLRQVGPFKERLYALALTRDGKQAALGAPGDKVLLMDVATGRVLATFPQVNRGGNMALTFSPNGDLLAALCDYTLSVWNVKEGKLVPLADADPGVTGQVSFSPDGKKLALAQSPSSALVVWDVTTGRKLFSAGAVEVLATSVAFSPDGKRVVTGGLDGTIRSWTADTGKEIWKVTLPSKEPMVNSVAFSPDGNQIVAGTDPDGLFLLRAADGKNLRNLTSRSRGISRVLFAPDGRSLVSWGGENVLHRWDPRSGAEIDPDDWFATRVQTLTFSPDGKILAAATDTFGDAWLLDVATGKKLRPLTPTKYQSPSLFAFSPDGKVLAGACYDAAICWDVATGQQTRKLAGHRGNFASLAFGAGGKTLITANDGESVPLFGGGREAAERPAFRTWDPGTGQTIHRFNIPPPPPERLVLIESYALAVSANGSVVAFNDYNEETLRLWNAGGTKTLDIKTKGTGWCVLSADARSAAIRSQNNEVHIWDTTTGKLSRQLPGAMPLAFSPDGRWLAIEDASRDSLSVFDLAIGSRALRVPFIGSPPTLAFSADGNTLAIAQADTTILLHDLKPLRKERP